MTTAEPPGITLRGLKLARLKVRYKRFFCDCELQTGEIITAHCPNPGRMLGVLNPDADVLLTHMPHPSRKLAYRLEAIRAEDVWVGVNTQWPNRLIHEALKAQTLAPLKDYPLIRPEVAYGHGSRIDFRLEGHPSAPDAMVEVKNVHYSRVTGLAEFPDSVTARGAKHLIELAEEAAKGQRAVLIFCIQRNDVSRIDVARDLDPAFARAYEAARRFGLEVFAYSWGWDENGLRFARSVDVA